MFAHLGREILGSTTFRYQGEEVILEGPWRRLPFFEAISKAVVSVVGPETGEEALRKAAMATGVPESKSGAGVVGLWKEIFDALVEPTLVQPTFITDFPIELSPLSKRKRSDPRLVDRFELFICRREIANAYSELNDPIDQRRRFEEQARERERGDEEAHWMDEDFVRALEYGMPPTAGEGIGVDRLAMLFTDSASIRDVILFPHLRPERRAIGQPAGDDDEAEI
jgi:lysyl-tRNA synthetase, class II